MRGALTPVVGPDALVVPHLEGVEDCRYVDVAEPGQVSAEKDNKMSVSM
jgi:hypothetical protein